jgi:hypothetical protein
MINSARLVCEGKNPKKPEATEYSRVYGHELYSGKFNQHCQEVGFNFKYELINQGIGTNTRYVPAVTLR